MLHRSRNLASGPGASGLRGSQDLELPGLMLDRGPDGSRGRIRTRAVARWILARHASQPFVWVWLVLLGALWPAVQLFSPLGVTSAAHGNHALVYEAAFLGLLVGSCFGLDALGRGGWIVDQLAAPQRLRVETLGVALSALVFLTAGLVAPTIFGALDTSMLPVLVPGALLSLFHLSALALLLRRSTLPASVQTVLLPLIAWALPATLISGGRGNRVGEIAGLWLDASRHLGIRKLTGTTPGSASRVIGETGYTLESLSTVFGTALAPIIVLALAAALIALRPRPHS